MNSRERVLAAVRHEEPDRVPIDMGVLGASGISVTAYYNLKKRLGLPTDAVRAFDIFRMLAWVEPDVLECLDIDTVPVPMRCPRFGVPIEEWKSWSMPDGTPVRVPIGFETAPEKEGGLLLLAGGRPVGRMPRGEHYFSEIANSTMGDVGTLEEPPDPDTVFFPLFDREEIRFRKQTAERLRRETDKALVLDITDNIRWQTSIPNWLYAMAADPERTYALHEKKSSNLLSRVKQLADALGSNVDIFAIYQDYGTQRGGLISADMFERLVAPHYRHIFGWIHEHTKWKILFHSCGSIVQLISHMIDMGVDILNPVQCAADGMAPGRLKREFGRRLAFWGGGVDT